LARPRPCGRSGLLVPSLHIKLCTFSYAFKNKFGTKYKKICQKDAPEFLAAK
jgi:hypothetical protein